MKLRVSCNKKGMSLLNLKTQFSRFIMFFMFYLFMFPCIKLPENRSEFTLNALAGAWPRFGRQSQIYKKNTQNANSKSLMIERLP